MQNAVISILAHVIVFLAFLLLSWLHERKSGKSGRFEH